MPNLTLSVDDETFALIKSHPAINWSHIAREAFRRKGRELHMWDAMLSESEVTEADARRFGDDAKRGILRRLGW